MPDALLRESRLARPVEPSPLQSPFGTFRTKHRYPRKPDPEQDGGRARDDFQCAWDGVSNSRPAEHGKGCPERLVNSRRAALSHFFTIATNRTLPGERLLDTLGLVQ